MSRLSERIENFDKAFILFKKMCDNYISDKNNDTFRLALTQSFEIVFELGWKVLKDYLATEGIEVFTPKDVIKSAFNMNILQDGQVWIDMSKDRNATSHEYNMDKVDIMLERISSVYYDELYRFSCQVREFYE